MSRVSTLGNYQSALLHLMGAQTRAAEAQERYSTQKNATDLTGFGRQSETLTALKGSQSRIQGFIDTTEAVEARLTTQDLAMNQIREGVGGAREAIANALATDSGASLMLDLAGAFQSVRGGLNTRHQGAYLFAGSATSTPPVAVDSLDELAAAPNIPGLFANDTLKTVSRVAEGTTLETGYLADELGAPAMTILRDLQIYHAGANGPLTGKLSEAQKAFLTTKLTELDQASTGVIDKVARTGALANQVEAMGVSHKAQLISLDKLVSNRTDADMAKAFTDLELSRISIEGSARVLDQLRQISLLNFLT